MRSRIPLPARLFADARVPDDEGRITYPFLDAPWPALSCVQNRGSIMPIRSLASLALLATFFPLSSAAVGAQASALVCHPTVTPPIIVATHDQIVAAGGKAEPPLTDTKGFGFAWPDTQMGVIKTADGYEWFTSDGAFHPR